MVRLAALDLGSNSFHLLDARCHENILYFGQRVKEKVQLCAGLDVEHNLSQTVINRGLDCLQRFHRHIEEQNIQHLVAVGTSTLRKAHNSMDFIQAAEDILNIPIQVISGKEEARLIFRGVNHEIIEQGLGLVIDIGGGSTEFAIGDKSQLKVTESLEMGCVSYYQRFFADGKIYSENVRAAEKSARLELEPHLDKLLANATNWIVGTSGTLQSLSILTHHLCGDQENSLRRTSLEALENRLILSGHVDDRMIQYLDDNRRAILPAGLAITKAIFAALGIEQITICQAALCEGLLLELSENL